MRRKAKSTVRTAAKKATGKLRKRGKKGLNARAAVRKMRVTPAQQQKLHTALRDFEKHIGTLTNKYNKILSHIAKL